MKKFAVLLTVSVLLASCAPKYNANAPKADSELSCSEIRTEITRARSARDEAAGNKGLSGQNVAWALLFWPGIFINESSNSDVVNKADERIGTLNNVASAKQCKL